MIIHIDTNTFPASPALYADAEKTKPLPRILPAVELQKGGFAVAFIGDNGPHAGKTLYLAASIVGSGVQVLAEWSDDHVNGAWGFDFALTSEVLAEEVKKRGSARLLVGIISDDDTERREWQFNTVVYPTASSEEIDAETVESAKNFAELAEQAAKRAQEAQADVAGNAQLAESAKQTATQAANAAIGAADNAEVSERNAAESKDAAEQAKADAEAAKTEAKKAASDAQNALGDVYTKSQIDGISTGAEVTLKMNEIVGYLKDYEEVTGEKLPFDFWEAVMAEFQRWQENPNEVKEWVTTSATESTSPYFSIPASKPIVEFNVVSCVSSVSECGVINIAHDVSAIFLPNVVNAQRMIRGISAEKVFVALPNATRLYGMAVRADAELVVYAPLATNVEAAIQRTTKNAKVIAPNATSASYFAQYASEFNNEVDFPKCTNWYAFASGASKYNQATNMESATKADAAFGATAMSTENIAATLDTLPAGKSDGSSKILFSRADGTKLTPLMAESPYKESVDAAVARGWTVQFD